MNIHFKFLNIFILKFLNILALNDSIITFKSICRLFLDKNTKLPKKCKVKSLKDFPKCISRDFDVDLSLFGNLH